MKRAGASIDTALYGGNPALRKERLPKRRSARYDGSLRSYREPFFHITYPGKARALYGLHQHRKAFSPDQTLLYVDDTASHWVYSYQIQADGSLADKQRYFHLHVPDTADDSGADGMRVDRDGRLYVATRLGIQVCDQAGRVNCILPTPNGKISNLCFGGANFDTLFVTCGDRVYQRKMKVKGANAFEAPIKPKAPRL